MRYKAPNGASLHLALEWLRPFAVGAKTHEKFVHSGVKFDQVRREAGLNGFPGTWDPKNASYLYQLAAHLDEAYAALAEYLSKRPVPWIVLCIPSLDIGGQLPSSRGKQPLKSFSRTTTLWPIVIPNMSGGREYEIWHTKETRPPFFFLEFQIRFMSTLSLVDRDLKVR
ncbi:MAG: hypothetical protein WBG50_27725 [Desulfomonilaceae bacterium]